MDYEIVVGCTDLLVVFKIRENLYAVVTLDGDVEYHSNWIYLLRYVRLKKGKPDEETLKKAIKILSEDKTDVDSLNLVPLEDDLKEVQDEYEEELEEVQ